MLLLYCPYSVPVTMSFANYCYNIIVLIIMYIIYYGLPNLLYLQASGGRGNLSINIRDK